MIDRPLTIGWCANVLDRSPICVTYTWADFVRELGHTQTLRADMPIEAAKKQIACFSPAHFADGVRNDASARGADILTLDFDEPFADFAALVSAWSSNFDGVASYTYSTARAQEGAVRARVVMPLDRTATRQEYPSLYAILIALAEQAWGPPDPTSKNIGRLNLWPSVPPNGFFRSATIEGEGLPVDELLHAHEATKPRAPRAVLAPVRHSDKYVQTALQREAEAVRSAPEGTRNATLNRSAYTLARLRDRGLADEVIARALGDAARLAGLTAREIDRTLASALGARRVA